MISPTGPTKGTPFLRQTKAGFAVKFGKRWSPIQIILGTQATNVKGIENLCNRIMKSKDNTAVFHQLTDLHHHLEQLSNTDIAERSLQQVQEAKKIVQSHALETLADNPQHITHEKIFNLLSEEKDPEKILKTLSVFLDGILEGTYGNDTEGAIQTAKLFLPRCPKDATILSKMCAAEMQYMGKADLHHMSLLLSSFNDVSPKRWFNISRNSLSPFLDGILQGTYGRDTLKAINIAKGFVFLCLDDATVLSKMCAAEMKYMRKVDLPHMSRLLNDISNASSKERSALSREALAPFLDGILAEQYGDKTGAAIAVAKGFLYFCSDDPTISEKMTDVKNEFEIAKEEVTAPPEKDAVATETPDPLSHMQALVLSNKELSKEDITIFSDLLDRTLRGEYDANPTKLMHARTAVEVFLNSCQDPSVLAKMHGVKAKYEAKHPFLNEILQGTYDDKTAMEAINVAEELLKFCPNDPVILAKMCAVKMKYSDESVEEILEQTIPKDLVEDQKEISREGFNILCQIALDSFKKSRIEKDPSEIITKKLPQWRNLYYTLNKEELYLQREMFLSTYSSLLKNSQLTVFHTLEDVPDIFSSEKEQVGEIVENEKAMNAIKNTCGRSSLFTADKKIDLGAEFKTANDTQKTEEFHKRLVAFYKEKKVSNPEKLVYALMLRMTGEYNVIGNLNFSGVLVEDLPYIVRETTLNDTGLHFDFENGGATVFQKHRYEKQDMGAEKKPTEHFDITRSISLNPNNITPKWKEVITIKPIESKSTSPA